MLQFIVQGIATLGVGAIVLICLLVAMRNDAQPMDQARMDLLRRDLADLAYAGKSAK